MELIKLTERVYYTKNDATNDRPVLGYVLGDRYSVMIDAGNSGNHLKEYMVHVSNAGLPLPEECLLTHWHWDHTFGMHAFHGRTIAHQKTNHELMRLAEWKWTDEAMKERLVTGEDIVFADEHMRVEYSDLTEIKVVPADVTFQNKLTFNCGGITCECHHVESAHSDDSVVVLIPEAEIAFLGDVYNDDFYQSHARDLIKTQKLHDALAEMAFEIAVVGHSEPIKKEQVLAFLKSFLNN